MCVSNKQSLNQKSRLKNYINSTTTYKLRTFVPKIIHKRVFLQLPRIYMYSPLKHIKFCSPKPFREKICRLNGNL